MGEKRGGFSRRDLWPVEGARFTEGKKETANCNSDLRISSANKLIRVNRAPVLNEQPYNSRNHDALRVGFHDRLDFSP